MDRAVEQAVEYLGSLDFAVNLTVNQQLNPIVRMTQQQFDQSIHTSLGGSFLISRAVGRVLLEQGRGGSLVHFSSIASSAAFGRGTGAYAASKAGVNALVRGVGGGMGALRSSRQRHRPLPGAHPHAGFGAGQPSA